MPLRLLELTISDQEAGRLPALLEKQSALGVWQFRSANGGVMVRILLDAEHVEALSDILIDSFGSPDDFRMILLAVEATLPRIEEPEEKQALEEKQSGEGSKPRLSREELYEDLDQASRSTPVFLVMVGLSTLVTAIGLIRNDVAVIIGAMVISPLLGPNVSLSLGCTLGDVGLVKRSLRALGAGVLLAVALSYLLGALLRIDPSTPEVAARTGAGLGSVLVALATGAAGALAFTTAIPAVLVGVMVAVALLPPLVSVGLLAGIREWGLAGGAGILLVVNVTCINLAAVATFLVQKVEPRTWWEEERAKKATRIAVFTWVLLLALLVAAMLYQRSGSL
jgi:uncharacterized hydrophobic protein (TIGR00341 family)